MKKFVIGFVVAVLATTAFAQANGQASKMDICMSLVNAVPQVKLLKEKGVFESARRKMEPVQQKVLLAIGHIVDTTEDEQEASSKTFAWCVNSPVIWKEMANKGN